MKKRGLPRNREKSRINRVRILSVLIVAAALAAPGWAKKEGPAAQTARDGWVSLFNGRDLEGWTPKFAKSEAGVNYKNTFRVEDGVLKASYDGYEKFDGEFGHLFYKEPFGHYILRVEYRFIGGQTPGGPSWAFRNSGVMFHSQSPESMGVEQSFPVSIEAQFLGGNGAEERPTANLCTPGTNVVMAGELVTRHCTNSTSATYHGDRWVTVELEVNGGGIVRHLIDGRAVIEYEQPQLDPADAEAQKLVKDGRLLLERGYIALQAESHPVEFRKVEIKVIKRKSVFLENLTWVEAEKALKDYDVALVALGARTKEHGPHLTLKNDYILAEYLMKRVADEVPVVVLPTLQYGYYPSFLEYPGSISIGADTFKNVVMDICKSMQGYGLKKFYVLNTGVSTIGPLAEAERELASLGITLRSLNILEADKQLPAGLLKQEGGTHADEGETSMMLYIAPETVDMSKAVKDFDPRPGRRGLTRNPKGTGNYSPSGVYGDPALATREKGKILVETTVREVVRQVRELTSLK